MAAAKRDVVANEDSERCKRHNATGRHPLLNCEVEKLLSSDVKSIRRSTAAALGRGSQTDTAVAVAEDVEGTMG
jgi:hypothetical protein